MQLHRKRDELQSLTADVLVLTFSSRAQAQQWRDETGVHFPLLLDHERTVYRAFGLESSLWRAWQPKVWLRYTHMLLTGWRWQGIRDDSSQLGGDFVVDGQGIVRLAHPSRDPTDRPAVANIVAGLKTIAAA